MLEDGEEHRVPLSAMAHNDVETATHLSLLSNTTETAEAAKGGEQAAAVLRVVALQRTVCRRIPQPLLVDDKAQSNTL